MTITPDADFVGHTSYFTNNKIIFTGETVIKNSASALFEFEWYKRNTVLDAPRVLFCNDETIITERIFEFEWYKKNTVLAAPKVLFCNDETIITERIYEVEGGVKRNIAYPIELMKLQKNWHPYPWQTYIDNIPALDIELPEQSPTMFHGDLSTTNVLQGFDGLYFIDPNYKGIFGNWMTDLGKWVFSLIAYEENITEAKALVDYYGLDVWKFAYAEGLRVAKYKEDYNEIIKEIKQNAG
jgi:hypothetical protein